MIIIILIGKEYTNQERGKRIRSLFTFKTLIRKRERLKETLSNTEESSTFTLYKT